MRQDKVLSISFAAIMFAGGLYCILAEGLTVDTVALISGLGLVFYALGHLFVWMSRLALGIADRWLLICAIAALLGGGVIWGFGMAHKVFPELMVYVSAACLVGCGILSILHSLGLRKIHVEYGTEKVGKNWPLLAVGGAAMIVAGAVDVAVPVAVLEGFSTFLGAGLIVGALSSVANVFAE